MNGFVSLVDKDVEQCNTSLNCDFDHCVDCYDCNINAPEDY